MNQPLFAEPAANTTRQASRARGEIKADLQQRFLTAFQQTGLVKLAARAIDRHPRIHSAWFKDDAGYREQFGAIPLPVHVRTLAVRVLSAEARLAKSGAGARRPFMLDKRPVFLEVYERTGSVKLASEAIGIDRSNHYQWLKEDLEYRAKFYDLQRIAAPQLHAQRAAVGESRNKPFWKSGRNKWREEARKRDGYKCRVCGFALVITVHHIISSSRGGECGLDNLITLCPNDHALADRGILSPQYLCALIA
jgi:HNH endonuclease